MSKAVESLQGLVEVFTEIADISEDVSTVLTLSGATNNACYFIDLVGLYRMLVYFVRFNNLIDSFK